MKAETYIGIAILVAFGLFVFLAAPMAKEVLYLFGCFMFGWQVPAMSRTLCNFFRKHKTA
jgi:hypothetical protein